jgi:hypothetical protein
MASTTQAIPLPNPDVESRETARPLPEPKTKETPFVIKLGSAIPG